MANQEFDLTPCATQPLDTPWRRIATPWPVPDSLPLLEKLRAREARSMRGQPPVVWRRAHDAMIEDAWGNRWVDWSSGVLVANAGHNHPAIVAALRAYLDSEAPLATYCFPHEARARLVERLVDLAPPALDRAFLLTTGSEATEVAIKLARTHGIRRDAAKRVIVSFEGGFHGRTYGAQLAGGVLGGGEWIDPNPDFVQVPFPGSIETTDRSFQAFERRLAERGIDPDRVAGVIGETFQGREVRLMPADYARDLRAWCDAHDAALIFDEVQAGFGRTGRLFAFEHLGVVPDLVCCGKGISSSLPLSAVLGRAEYLDLYGPGEMTSTHTGSPLPVVAALANIEALIGEGLVDRAAAEGAWLGEQLRAMAAPYSDRIDIGGVGLVWAMLFFRNRAGLEPDPDAAFRFVDLCVRRGNLFFAPVGKGGGAVKFCPPLCIERAAMEDALFGTLGIRQTLAEALEAAAPCPRTSES